MLEKIKDEDWVYVVIIVNQTPGGDQLLGQTLPGNDGQSPISFIPAWQSKEDALKCWNLLALDGNKKHEVQAIIYEDLKARARENGFVVFVMDGEGNILFDLKLIDES